jgi:ABC-type oligopeptide transport system substrate-binding subunit
VYAVCGAPASFVCEPHIEELWARHQASLNPEERDQLSKAIQRLLIQEYYMVPIYVDRRAHHP